IGHGAFSIRKVTRESRKERVLSCRHFDALTEKACSFFCRRRVEGGDPETSGKNIVRECAQFVFPATREIVLNAHSTSRSHRQSFEPPSLITKARQGLKERGRRAGAHDEIARLAGKFQVGLEMPRRQR